MTQRQLARRLGVGRVYVVRRESGERKIPVVFGLAVVCLSDHLGR